MIDNIIIETTKEYFFNSNKDIESLFQRFHFYENYKKGKQKHIEYIERKDFSNPIINGLGFIQIGEKDKVLIINFANAHAPMISIISSVDLKEIEGLINFLYGLRTNYIYKYTTDLNSNDIKDFNLYKKNKLLYYLVSKSYRFSKENINYSMKIIQSIRMFIISKYGNFKSVNELTPRSEVALRKRIIETILLKAFLNPKDFLLERIINQRSVFIGQYLYPLLMKKTKYNEEEWDYFILSIKEDFTKEALNLLKEIDKDNYPSTIFNSFKKKRNKLSLIKLAKERVEKYGDRLFEKDGEFILNSL